MATGIEQALLAFGGLGRYWDICNERQKSALFFHNCQINAHTACKTAGFSSDLIDIERLMTGIVSKRYESLKDTSKSPDGVTAAGYMRRGGSFAPILTQFLMKRTWSFRKARATDYVTLLDSMNDEAIKLGLVRSAYVQEITTAVISEVADAEMLSLDELLKRWLVIKHFLQDEADGNDLPTTFCFWALLLPLLLEKQGFCAAGAFSPIEGSKLLQFLETGNTEKTRREFIETMRDAAQIGLRRVVGIDTVNQALSGTTIEGERLFKLKANSHEGFAIDFMMCRRVFTTRQLAGYLEANIAATDDLSSVVKAGRSGDVSKGLTRVAQKLCNKYLNRGWIQQSGVMNDGRGAQHRIFENTLLTKHVPL